MIGTAREGFDEITFRITVTKPVLPGLVTAVVFHTPGQQLLESLPIVADTDSDLVLDNEYKNAPPWDTTLKPLTSTLGGGLWFVEYTAEDALGRHLICRDEFTLISSYGRNFGLEYGNGL